MCVYGSGLPVFGSRNSGVDLCVAFATGSPVLYMYHSSRHTFATSVGRYGRCSGVRLLCLADPLPFVFFTIIETIQYCGGSEPGGWNCTLRRVVSMSGENFAGHVHSASAALKSAWYMSRRQNH